MTSLYSVNYQLRAHKRDRFIEFIKSLLLTPFITSQGTLDGYQSVFESLEELVNEHRLKTSQNVPTTSRLYQLCPSIGQFFTTLPLTESFVEIDKRRSICGRKHIPPSFNDIRHILNYAQIKSIAKDVQLITFDGDMTLYQDGADFSADSQLVSLIIQLLKFGVKIAIVTAAGYQEDPTRYEQRLSGLLLGFKASDLTHEQLSNFYVFGGECNFLFRFNPVTMHLVYIPASVYQPDTVKRWSENTERIQQLLDVAQKAFENAVTSMGLESKTTLVRKQRAVGIIKRNGYPLTREQLDELALAVKVLFFIIACCGTASVCAIFFGSLCTRSRSILLV